VRVTEEETGRVLRIERTFDAAAEDVFDAWTSEEVMCRWFHAGPDWDTASAEVDLRVGGEVRIVMRGPSGNLVQMGGEYTLIEKPRRLEFTWNFSDHPGNLQRIELEFTERNGRTTVVMVNSQISTDRRREEQQWGWGRCFDELERVLGS
jgi:uncharacterized protein YndB with AHSA1/START domain